MIDELLEELRALGDSNRARIYANHGISPAYGVKVADLKKILKRLKGRQELGPLLYDTGIYDAMYLAGLLTDGAKLSEAELQGWAERLPNHAIAEYTLPWVASEHPAAWQLACRWIDSEPSLVAVAGWTTLACIVGMRPDEALDIAALRQLLQRAERELPGADNWVRYAMNNFLISLGTALPALTEEVLAAAARLGRVEVDMGKTACKVPDIAEAIEKVRRHGSLGKKRKTFKC